MKATLRHIGVFFIGFAAAFVIADNLREDQDATRVYLYFLILFMVYLGVSYLLTSRRRG